MCNMESFYAWRAARLTGLILLALQLSFTVLAGDDTNSGETQIEMTLSELLGDEEADRYNDIVKTDELISWRVYLPNNDSGEIPGVFVYVSPTRSGAIHPQWREVMDQQNLIYISTDHSGNRKPTIRRMVLALMAIRVLASQYAFDLERVTISGFSGGGRVASILSVQYPEVFSGALYICGVDFWKKKRAPKVDRLVQNRFVFLTGSRDFNRDETRNIHGRYVKAGAKNSKLIIIPGMTHELPNQKYLGMALEYLAGRAE